MDLFTEAAERLATDRAPLAVRMRPRSLDDFAGQHHLLDEGRPLRILIEQDALRSVILWGPPGSGKTTLASLVAETTQRVFVTMSAVTAGVKDVREVIEGARRRLGENSRGTILFLDEIHRFNRAQQDALLPAVEDGTIVLIGATTENPFFEINGPLLSRAMLFRLDPLDSDALFGVLDRALAAPEGLAGRLGVDSEARGHLLTIADGDARRLLNAVEVAAALVGAAGRMLVTVEDVESAANLRVVTYDRTGDAHYDVVSAFIKSMRGSDADASLYWLARMVQAGEDPRFIARRMVILASEDVGLADPQALVVAVAAAHALEFVGLPEAGLNLAEAAVYLARAPKSNSVIEALSAATRDVQQEEFDGVPPHLRDAHYRGARRLGHGVGYLYPHEFPGHQVEQQYLPDRLAGHVYYRPSDQGAESTESAGEFGPG